MTDKFIIDVLSTVPTFKRYRCLQKIKEVCLILEDAPRILIIGAGQGAEAIVCDRYTHGAYILAVDHWKQEFMGVYSNVHSKNEKSSFIANCQRYGADVDSVELNLARGKEFFESSYINQKWDFIYYDAMDGWEDWQVPVVLGYLESLWPLLNSGGAMMGDDYYMTPPKKHGRQMMRPIVDEFCKKKNLDLEAHVDRNYWLVWK